MVSLLAWWIVDRSTVYGSFKLTAGALDGGSPCRLSILRNANVACLCRLLMSMSHVEFKKYPCLMSLYFFKPCRMSIGSMSHVEFKKWPCRPVEFEGQGPYSSQHIVHSCMVHTDGSQLTANSLKFTCRPV